MSIDFKEYQKASSATSGAHQDLYGREARLSIGALGLTGEAGEVADYIKKVVGHNHPLDKDTLVKELGDVLWYVAELCSTIGVDMGDVASANVKKLKKRYPDGFSKERSINRAAYAAEY